MVSRISGEVVVLPISIVGVRNVNDKAYYTSLI